MAVFSCAPFCFASNLTETYDYFVQETAQDYSHYAQGRDQAVAQFFAQDHTDRDSDLERSYTGILSLAWFHRCRIADSPAFTVQPLNIKKKTTIERKKTPEKSLEYIELLIYFHGIHLPCLSSFPISREQSNKRDNVRMNNDNPDWSDQVQQIRKNNCIN